LAAEAHPFPVWQTYKTPQHPTKDSERLYPLKEPYPKIPKSNHDYRGDQKDPVMEGSRRGMCLVEDYLSAKRKAISKWKTKIILN
jgi:hypothetical protein